MKKNPKDWKEAMVKAKKKFLEAEIEYNLTLVDLWKSLGKYYDEEYGTAKTIKCPKCGSNKNYPVRSLDRKNMLYHCTICQNEWYVTIQEWKEEQKRIMARVKRINEGEKRKMIK